MSAQINKNGIVSVTDFYEQIDTNLAVIETPVDQYSYTPTAVQNSCLAGWIVDFTQCESNEILFQSIDVEYSGFDRSNTTGTFSIWFQGAVYNNETKTYVWTSNSGVTNNIVNGSSSLTSTVLSQPSGTAHFECYFKLAAPFPQEYSKQRFGIRSDYSNGTGTITLKNLKVIPLRFLAGSARISKDTEYVSSNQFYEI